MVKTMEEINQEIRCLDTELIILSGDIAIYQAKIDALERTKKTKLKSYRILCDEKRKLESP